MFALTTIGSVSGGAAVLICLGFGFLMAIPAIASALGSIFGRGANASAENDANKTAASSRMNDQRLSQYQTQQGAQMQQGQLDLNRQQFNESSEASRMKRALIGALLGNVQDAQISVPGIKTAQISGGLRPSALGENGRGLAELMAKLASEKAQAGNTYQGGEMLAPPNLTDLGGMRQGGNGILNALAGISSAIGGVGKSLQGGGGGNTSGLSQGMIDPNVVRYGGTTFR